jgi:uncharacterized protein YegP (UPF0339 family)
MSVKINKFRNVSELVQIKKAKGGYITYIKGANGEILMTSEILKTYQNAENNLLSAMSNLMVYMVFCIYGEEAYNYFPNIMTISESELKNSLQKHFKGFKENKPKAKKIKKAKVGSQKVKDGIKSPVKVSDRKFKLPEFINEKTVSDKNTGNKAKKTNKAKVGSTKSDKFKKSK